MKKIPIIFSLILVFNLLSGSLHAQMWHPLEDGPQTYRFDDIFFLSPNEGWAINPYYSRTSFDPNEYGRVFKTNDGGRTWEKIHDSSTTYFRAVGFADNQNGWIGNLGNEFDSIPLYRTFDGGYTWDPVTNIPNPVPKGICGISVVSKKVIYAYGRYFGPPIMLKSTDGGNEWSSQDLSEYSSGLIDAHFVSKDTGFVVGCYDSIPKALILSTFDGGQTWQVRHKSNRSYERAWKIVFPSRNIGYASIQNFHGMNHILKTTNGGLTWSELPTIADYNVQGIGFLNDSVGWVGGSAFSAGNFKTTDGGLNWSVDYSFGSVPAPYNNRFEGNSINRFRSFGDTLMYASGQSIYKYGSSGTIRVDPKQNKILLLPNPAYDLAFLRLYELYPSLEISFFDMAGRKVKMVKPISTRTVRLDISDLNIGTYIIKVISANKELYSDKILIID